MDASTILQRTARAVARSRGDAALRPEDESAARAVIDELTAMGLVLTPAARHALRGAHLQQLQGAPLHALDLWETACIQVQLWLMNLGLDEERAARAATTTLLPPTSRPDRAAA